MFKGYILNLEHCITCKVLVRNCGHSVYLTVIYRIGAKFWVVTTNSLWHRYLLWISRIKFVIICGNSTDIWKAFTYKNVKGDFVMVPVMPQGEVYLSCRSVTWNRNSI